MENVIHQLNIHTVHVYVGMYIQVNGICRDGVKRK